MVVADVMTSPVLTVSPGTTLADLLELLQTRKISGAPVIDARGRLAGIVSRQDIVLQELRHSRGQPATRVHLDRILNGGFVAVSGQRLRSRETTVEGIMTPASSIRSCGPGMALRRACSLMANNAIHRLPVLQAGRLVGILTTTDVVRAVGQGRL